MKKRQGSLKNKGIIICAIVAVLLCVWTSAFSLSGHKDILRSATVVISSPFTSLFDRLGAAAARASDALFAYDDNYFEWSQQKDELEQKIAEQEAQLAALQQLQKENEQLREYLGLTSADNNAGLMLLESRTIYTADTTGRLITLDRGSRDGVEVGMPVMDKAGILGVVCEVTKNTCKVATLMDESVYIGARDTRSGISGTLCGMENGQQYCIFRFLDANIDRVNDLRVGDRIVTGGSSDHFPSGLVLGHIVKVGVDPYDRSPFAYVRLAANTDAHSSLLMIVLGEEEPASVPEIEPEPMPPEETQQPEQPEDPSEPEQPDATEQPGQDESEQIPVTPDEEESDGDEDGQNTQQSAGFAGNEEVLRP